MDFYKKQYATLVGRIDDALTQLDLALSDGGTLLRQFSDGKQRTVNVARNSKLPKTCRRKRDSKTVGFGGVLPTLPPLAKWVGPQAETPRPGARNNPLQSSPTAIP